MLFVCFTPKSVIKALTNCLVAEILTLCFFIKALDTLHSYIMHKHTKCKVKYFPPQIVGALEAPVAEESLHIVPPKAC